MAALCYLSPCIHILFSEIWDDVTLNFHSLGLIQYSLRPIRYRKLSRDHNLPTLLNTVCVVSLFINKLIRKENNHCFRTARQPRPTAATAPPRHFPGAPNLGIFPLSSCFFVCANLLAYKNRHNIVQLSMQTMRTKCVSCSLLPSGTQRMSRCGTWIGLDAVTGDLCHVQYKYTQIPFLLLYCSMNK
jgi:hypothetical protein